MITNAFSLEKITPPRKIGGAEAYAERIAKSLLLKDHSILVITQRPFEGLRSLLPKKETREGLTIYSFYPLNIFSIYYTHKKTLLQKGIWRFLDLVNPLPAILVYWIIKKERPCLIHNHILHGFSPLFLLRLLERTKIPLIQTLHSYGYLCLRCNLLRHNQRVCLKMPLPCRLFVLVSRTFVDSTPDIVISPSVSCLGIYERYHFFAKSKKMVLPYGVETYSSNPHQEIKDAQAHFKVLYAGRLVPEKGVDVLIRAFKKLSSLKAELTIVGEGAVEPYLKQLASGDRRIRFAGKISWEELKELYRTYDVTVMPSVYYEPLGNIVLESMSHGTPSIVSRIGGLEELIQDGCNGYLFEPGNADELKIILQRLMDNPQQLKRMGENAFISAKKYALQNHVNELEKIYLTPS
jgi:glycosyltransferase involved in cell wall biosynthesis